MRYTPLFLAAVLGLSTVGTGTAAFAETATANNAGLNALPPALKAAVLSGNAEQITQAITTLSAGNPKLVAKLAYQVLVAAELLLSTNPQVALNAASAAMAVTNNPSVTESSPQVAMDNAVIASRIIINPNVIAVNPSAANNIAVAIVTLVSRPSVYAVNPKLAIEAMSNAFTIASNPMVLAVAPGAQDTMTQLLTDAAKNTSLSAASPDTPSDIAAILAKPEGILVAQPQANQPPVNIVTTPATDITTLPVSPSTTLPR
jgi:hypothetical protein